MKLRIQGDSLRLRLTRPEVARLREQGVIEETAHFAGGRGLTYRIRKDAAGADLRAEFTEGAITVYAPAATVDHWASSDEVGMETRGGALKIAIEKDFRCMSRRGEASEADAYPHPSEQAH